MSRGKSLICPKTIKVHLNGVNGLLPFFQGTGRDPWPQGPPVPWPRPGHAGPGGHTDPQGGRRSRSKELCLIRLSFSLPSVIIPSIHSSLRGRFCVSCTQLVATQIVIMIDWLKTLLDKNVTVQFFIIDAKKDTTKKVYVLNRIVPLSWLFVCLYITAMVEFQISCSVGPLIITELKTASSLIDFDIKQPSNSVF